MRIKRKPSEFVIALMAVSVWIAGSNSALAFGFGFGDMMWGGFRTVPSPTDFLNQHSLKAAARGMQGPTQNRAYGPGSNSFHNLSRDPGFVSTGELSRRRFPTSSRAQTNRSPGNTARAETQPRKPAEPEAKPVPPLASFFDAALKLAWPSESPVNGDLKGKRDISDQHSLAVLDETRRYQTASLATSTEARQKLLDYGRPALREIRAASTAPIADAFHQFMLSLYDSLGQAASAR